MIKYFIVSFVLLLITFIVIKCFCIAGYGSSIVPLRYTILLLAILLNGIISLIIAVIKLIKDK